MKKTDDELLKVIVEGAGKMPAAESLNAQEQKKVLRIASPIDSVARLTR